MSFDQAELDEFKKQFDTFDADRNGSITALELQSALKAVGEHVSRLLYYFALSTDFLSFSYRLAPMRLVI
jgi:hypothetical protein